jgi:hypothetical protein
LAADLDCHGLIKPGYRPGYLSAKSTDLCDSKSSYMIRNLFLVNKGNQGEILQILLQVYKLEKMRKLSLSK